MKTLFSKRLRNSSRTGGRCFADGVGRKAERAPALPVGLEIAPRG